MKKKKVGELLPIYAFLPLDTQSAVGNFSGRRSVLVGLRMCGTVNYKETCVGKAHKKQISWGKQQRERETRVRTVDLEPIDAFLFGLFFRTKYVIMLSS